MDKEKIDEAKKELKSFIKEKDCRFWIGLNGEKAVHTILQYIDELEKEYIPKQKIIDKLELYRDDRSIFNYDNEIHLLEQLLEE